MDAMGRYFFIFISVYSILVELDAVTVNPSLCPTNKIAPHRRQASWEQSRPRTLGFIHNLFGHGRPPFDPLNDLQEQPQEDDQDDCGEIEDYDETDLSSVTPNGPRRKTDRKDRHFFGNNYIPPHYHGSNKPTSAPYRPQRPTRPPYNFEGNYGPNGYRPPSHQYPGHIKPVKEDMYDHPPEAYRPGLIGGVLGHIVGFPSVRPPPEDPPLRDFNYPFRFPEKYEYTNNNRRKKSQNTNKSTSIIGSFVDLFFN